MANKLWTRDELIVAFNLYLQLPFGKMHKGNSEIIQLAKLIGRTPDAVAMRLTNFAHVDPYHQQRGVKGMSGGRKQVEPIWNEFINNREDLLFESERILAQLEHQTIEEKYKKILKDVAGLKGATKLREVKTRVNQDVFRRIVIANYSGKCAISGINVSRLLVASHILPWSKNENERLNPQNGICLSSLYDCAFDNGLIGISEDYRILLSSEIKAKKKESYYKSFFGDFENKAIVLPARFLPSKDFLKYHLKNQFRN